MAAAQHYDAIVIGSGQGGNPLAKALAAAGRKTAVVERERVGGTCINVGCTPTNMEVVLEAEVQHTAPAPAGKIELTVRSAGARDPRTITGSHLLIAAGRVPNSDRLNLDAAGVETDRQGYIQVNEPLETTVSGVYGLGDVKGGSAFTHISYDDFRILETNLLKGGPATTRGRLVPYTVFMDPKLGRVGCARVKISMRGSAVADQLLAREGGSMVLYVNSDVCGCPAYHLKGR